MVQLFMSERYADEIHGSPPPGAGGMGPESGDAYVHAAGAPLTDGGPHIGDKQLQEGLWVHEFSLSVMNLPRYKSADRSDKCLVCRRVGGCA